MKNSVFSFTMHRSIGVFLILITSFFVSSCSSDSGYKEAGKTGESIQTLNKDLSNIKLAVDNSMQSLNALSAGGGDTKKLFGNYSKSVDAVEDASKTATKHADKMRELGQDYFKDWKAKTGAMKNEEIRKLSQERQAQLQSTFSAIPAAAQNIKQSLPSYLSDLKDLRTALGNDLTPQGISAAKGIIQRTHDGGAVVQGNLSELSQALTAARSALTSTQTTP